MDVGFGFSPMDSFMFNIFPMIFTVMFIVILGFFIFVIIKGITQWNKNNHSPILTVDSKIVAKRTHVSRHHHDANNDGIGHTSTSSTYYVTFEVQSGDRMELQINSSEYGLIVEGDIGKLTFQGTRFLNFERTL